MNPRKSVFWLLVLQLFLISLSAHNNFDYPPDKITEVLRQHEGRKTNKVITPSTLSSSSSSDKATTKKSVASKEESILRSSKSSIINTAEKRHGFDVAMNTRKAETKVESIKKDGSVLVIDKDKICEEIVEEEEAMECIDEDHDGYDDTCDCEEEDGGNIDHGNSVKANNNGNDKGFEHSSSKSDLEPNRLSKSISPQSSPKITAKATHPNSLTDATSSVASTVGKIYSTRHAEAIVFAWPSLVGYNSASSNTKATTLVDRVGLGNEFTAAVTSIRKHNPTMPIFLFTNVNATIAIDNVVLDTIEVVSVDLIAESGMQAELFATSKSVLVTSAAPDAVRLVARIQSLLYGWKAGLLPEKVLLLTPNIIVNDAKDSVIGLKSAFEPLQHYDIAGCYEGFGSSELGSLGWGINADVLAIRGSAAGLLSAWLVAMKAESGRYLKSLDHQQQALMLLLERLPQYRAFPLPSTFNFKLSTVLPSTFSKLDQQSTDQSFNPVVINSNVFSDKRLSVKALDRAARVVVVSTIEKGLFGIKKEGYPEELNDRIAPLRA